MTPSPSEKRDKNSNSPPGNERVGKLLRKLIKRSILLAEDWEELSPTIRAEVEGCVTPRDLLVRLVELGVLTEFQAKRIANGQLFGLVLGHYRVLDRLGNGSSGVVYLGEHIVLRRSVAIKVLRREDDHRTSFSSRFHNEMRATAGLNHPNIIMAFDAGYLCAKKLGGESLAYFVMEYVPGENLQDLVTTGGPLSPSLTCKICHRIAAALLEAHRHNLVHRDVKPSNIIAMPDGEAKLLDFGLVRHALYPVTEHGKLMGTVAYMAPEQLDDSSAVDARADIFALGGTMYFCLTGEPPFETKGLLYKAIAQRMTRPVPSVRKLRPEVPAELDAVIMRMMALNRDERIPNSDAVVDALKPFVAADSREVVRSPKPMRRRYEPQLLDETPEEHFVPRVLVVDDTIEVGGFCKYVLQSEGIQCDMVESGIAAIDAAHAKRYDAILLDVDLPDISGQVVCRRLREQPQNREVKIVMMSGRASADEMAQIMIAGADDFLTKPISVLQLQARMRNALGLQEKIEQTPILSRQVDDKFDKVERVVNHGTVECQIAPVEFPPARRKRTSS